jgi:hypothetical protein
LQIPRPRRLSRALQQHGSGSWPEPTRTATASCARAVFQKLRHRRSKVIEAVLGEENRKTESIFDLVQGITAVARGKVHQDARLGLEGKAKRLMERAI